MKGTKISSHVCGSPCHVNIVFSSKTDHVCSGKDLNMFIQVLGQGCDCFLPACCVVYNARLLLLLDNPAHSQGRTNPKYESGVPPMHKHMRSAWSFGGTYRVALLE